MIEKNIFMIWFGNFIPKYIFLLIDKYKELNPDFNIVFINRNLNQLSNIKNKKYNNEYDEYIGKSYDFLNGSDKKYLSYITQLKKNYLENELLDLSDVLRLELINQIGGIYVDCDVFPLRPFDEELLKKNRFVVKVHHTDTFFSTDNFFIGSIKQFDNDYLKMPFLNPSNCYHLTQTIKKWNRNVNYIKNRYYFYKGQFDMIVPSLKNNFYIEHYTKRYL